MIRFPLHPDAGSQSDYEAMMALFAEYKRLEEQGLVAVVQRVWRDDASRPFGGGSVMLDSPGALLLERETERRRGKE